MNTKYTEEEDKFILWFKENYKNILIGILFGVTIITSYKFYTDSKVNSMHNISLKYEQVMNDYKNNNNKSLLKLSKELSETNPNNIYTNMLNLYAAKIFYETGNYDKSLGKLNLVISNIESDDIKIIAQLRKIRIMLAQNKLDSAYEYIISINSYDNNPFLIELIGDIYYKKNNQKLAREFYQKSLQFNLSPNKTKIIKNKIDLLQK
jgi:predicted negative regulator of RcsB-dependent stress response